MMPISEGQRVRAKRYRDRHPERVRESRRKWRVNNPEKTMKHSKDYAQRNRVQRRLKQKVYAENNPEVVRCHWKAARTTVPMARSCELCPDDDKRVENLEKHHPDHNYPDIFVTVCPSCHHFAEESAAYARV
jgi:hypothetical protein